MTLDSELEVAIKAFHNMAENQRDVEKSNNRRMVANWLTELKTRRTRDARILEAVSNLSDKLVSVHRNTYSGFIIGYCKVCGNRWEGFEAYKHQHVPGCEHAALILELEGGGDGETSRV